VARAFLRAVAAYFSDVLLWISIASAFEVFLVVGMGLLCILSAGYFFEGMKKNPFVLVLGGIVALAGTFLMFREVRGMIFPPPAVIAAPAQEQPDTTPQSDAIVPPSAPADDAFKPFTLTCAGLPQSMCSINPKCTWSMSINACLTSVPAAPAPGWSFPSSSYDFTTCMLLPSEAACKEIRACYWSPLFKRCEKLLFGTGLGAAKPAEPNCNSLSEPVCKLRAGCVWILNGCMTDLLKKPLGQ
jgi:hypothetical protein